MNMDSVNSTTTYQLIESDGANLRMLLRKYFRNWPWFVLSTVLMLALGYVYLKTQQPIYQIQASLLIQDEQKGNQSANALKEIETFAPKKVVENEIEILRSFRIMERVVRKLNLNISYLRDNSIGIGKHEIYTESPVELVVERATPTLSAEPVELSFSDNQSVQIGEQWYPLNQVVNTPYGRLMVKTRRPVGSATEPVFVKVSKMASAVYGYLNNLKAEPTSKTSTVVLLTLEDAVPARGEAILNHLIDEYNQAAVLDKNKVAANSLRFIEDRLSIISRELTGIEREVESYKSTQGITDLSTQAQTFLQTVQQNDAMLNQVNIQLSMLNDLQKYVNSRPDYRKSTPAMVGLNDPVLLGLINKMTELESQRERLSHTTSDKNPLLETLDSQIKATKSNMVDNIRTMKDMLVSSQQQYQNKNSSMESKIRTIPQKERSLMNITRQQAIKNDLYTYLLQKREETAVAFASTISDSRTIDSAQSTDIPIKPVGITIYALFGMLGLFFPVAVITARDLLNDRVRRRVDVEEVTQIPIISELVKKRTADSLVVTPHNQSMLAEQIRTLRAKVQLQKKSENQVLLFTSSISGEGKSFVSANLGLSLALVDKLVVIVDMDLRAPKLHTILDVSGDLGISNYLMGQATLDDILQPVPGCPKYFIIPSGSSLANPSEMLSSYRLAHLMQDLRERFDYVIIDTPPIGLVSDAQVVAPLSDATFFLVRHDVTPRNHLKMIDTLYREHSFRKLNIILNAVDGSDYVHYKMPKNKYAYGRKEAKKALWPSVIHRN